MLRNQAGVGTPFANDDCEEISPQSERLMQAPQLALFAHQIARNAQRLTAYGSTKFPDTCLNQYWATSKCRVQRWQESLGQLDRALISDPDDHPHYWNYHAPTVAEIFFGDMVSAVWTGLLRSASADDANSLVPNIFESERAARDRAATLLARACDLNLRRRSPIAVLDHLHTARKQADIWVDLLVGYIWPQPNVYACGILPNRVAQNAENVDLLRRKNALAQLDRRVAVEMKNMFKCLEFAETDNGNKNREICLTIQDCLANAKLVEAV